MASYQYRKSHCGDKTILRLSYLYNGISYTGKTTSLYWIGALFGTCLEAPACSSTLDMLDRDDIAAVNEHRLDNSANTRRSFKCSRAKTTWENLFFNFIHRVLIFHAARVRVVWWLVWFIISQNWKRLSYQRQKAAVTVTIVRTGYSLRFLAKLSTVVNHCKYVWMGCSRWLRTIFSDCQLLSILVGCETGLMDYNQWCLLNFVILFVLHKKYMFGDFFGRRVSLIISYFYAECAGICLEGFLSTPCPLQTVVSSTNWNFTWTFI